MVVESFIVEQIYGDEEECVNDPTLEGNGAGSEIEVAKAAGGFKVGREGEQGG